MKDTLAPQVRFGAFELDVRRGELREGERAIQLQEQPLRILLMLVERDGEIVTREEIQKKLWPDDTVVEFDQSINAAIKKVRKALGDSADEPTYIRTVAKQGYRLIPVVERLPRNGDGPVLSSPTTDIPFTAASSRARFRWSWLLAILLVAAGLVTAIVFWRRQKAHKFTDKDTIVLADFDNQTGEPVFDDTLKQALSAQLSQSPFLNLLSNRDLRRALQGMNRSPNEPLTENLARQVCQHTGSNAVLAGSIGSLSKEYILGLKTVDCSSHEILAEVQVTCPPSLVQG